MRAVRKELNLLLDYYYHYPVEDASCYEIEEYLDDCPWVTEAYELLDNLQHDPIFQLLPPKTQIERIQLITPDALCWVIILPTIKGLTTHDSS